MARRGEEADSSGAAWLVLRHTPIEGLGLLANALREVGVSHRYVDAYRGEPLPRDLRDVGGVIVLGGPMAAYDAEQHAFLRHELTLIERALTGGRPVLGICLGAQMIAQVLGARVYRGDRSEVGWGPITLTDEGRSDPLFADRHDSLTVFHLHADTYELPPDSVNLATSPLYDQQAFRWGDLVYGMQFHLELTDGMVSRLASDPESSRLIVDAGGDPQAITTNAAAHVEALKPVVRDVFTTYLQQCGL